MELDYNDKQLEEIVKGIIKGEFKNITCNYTIDIKYTKCLLVKVVFSEDVEMKRSKKIKNLMKYDFKNKFCNYYITKLYSKKDFRYEIKLVPKNSEMSYLNYMEEFSFLDESSDIKIVGANNKYIIRVMEDIEYVLLKKHPTIKILKFKKSTELNIDILKEISRDNLSKRVYIFLEYRDDNKCITNLIKKVRENKLDIVFVYQSNTFTINSIDIAVFYKGATMYGVYINVYGRKPLVEITQRDYIIEKLNGTTKSFKISANKNNKEIINKIKQIEKNIEKELIELKKLRESISE